MIVFAVVAVSCSFILFSITYISGIKSARAKINHVLSETDDIIVFEQFSMTFYGRVVKKVIQARKNEVYKGLQRHITLLTMLSWFSLFSCVVFPVACFLVYSLHDIGKLYAFATAAGIGLLNLVFLPVNFRPVNLWR